MMMLAKDMHFNWSATVSHKKNEYNDCEKENPEEAHKILISNSSTQGSKWNQPIGTYMINA